MSDLVENERTKLLAGALDRASTAYFTVGVLAPVAAAIYGAGSFGLGPIASALVALVWILAAVALHWLARVILGALRS